MNPKKALRKGLASITEEEFINTAMSFAKEDTSQDSKSNAQDHEMLKKKYPIYKQVTEMTMSAAKSGDQTQLLHFSGMSLAYRILFQLAEDKGR